MSTTVRELLAEAVVPREVIDRFLDPGAHNWARFDAELGYRPQTSIIRDGLDGCYTISHYASSGERRTLNFADQPCRMNSYGDSFTQCHQVSDGETWQEYLAAHLGEPVRNFGVGGYGVYQAYRRLLREEGTALACPYIIFNVYSDDHVRNIHVWRWLHVRDYRRHFFEHVPGPAEASMFHCNPWAHMRFDLDSGTFEEIENSYPTPASLYLLCDRDHVVETFTPNFVVQAFAAEQGAVDVDRAMLQRAADALSITADFSSLEAAARTGAAILLECGLRASEVIFDKLQAYVAAKGKRLLVMLSCPSTDVINAILGRGRFDQRFVDYLQTHAFTYVDGLRCHLQDYSGFRLSPQEYVQRYYIGHYNPKGNHFYAFAVKNAVVDWLDPEPLAYRSGGVPLQELAAALT